MTARVSISYRNRPVIVVEPIDSSQFDDLDTFGKLIDKQDLGYVIVTQSGFSKYENLQFSEKELQNITTKEEEL